MEGDGKLKQRGVYNWSKKEWQACKDEERAVEKTEEEWGRGDEECKERLNCKGNRSNQ